MASAMRVRRIRFTIRTLFIAIAIGAIPMAFFLPGPRVEVQSVEQAVEVAAALAMQEDATFRPDKHRAEVYREFGSFPKVWVIYPGLRDLDRECHLTPVAGAGRSGPGRSGGGFPRCACDR
jgi:hypothetical protein